MKTVLASLIAAATSILIPLAPTASASWTYWGAIAYSPGADQHYIVVDASSYYNAQSGALNGCGYSDCVIEWTFDTCAAVAYSPSWHVYNDASGSSVSDAQYNAERYTDSYPVLWGCN